LYLIIADSQDFARAVEQPFEAILYRKFDNPLGQRLHEKT
jgi:hypothetical protein